MSVCPPGGRCEAGFRPVRNRPADRPGVRPDCPAGTSDRRRAGSGRSGRNRLHLLHRQRSSRCRAHARQNPPNAVLRSSGRGRIRAIRRRGRRSGPDGGDRRSAGSANRGLRPLSAAPAVRRCRAAPSTIFGRSRRPAPSTPASDRSPGPPRAPSHPPHWRVLPAKSARNAQPVRPRLYPWQNCPNAT